MLDVEDVSVHFGGVAAVRDVSFSVLPGHVTAIVGPNGAGKTTLLNSISGVTRVAHGTICIAGKSAARLPPYRRARLGIGRTFQTPVLVESVSVVENVMMGFPAEGFDHLSCLTGLSSRGDRWRRGRALEALEGMGLGALADDRAARLPHGQRKMVELARAVVSKPQLLLLDEPASGLHDAEVVQTAEAITTFTSGGVAVLMVEHHMGLVRRVSDDVVVLDFGEVIAHGTPDEVAADPKVVGAYLGTEQL